MKTLPPLLTLAALLACSNRTDTSGDAADDDGDAAETAPETVGDEEGSAPDEPEETAADIDGDDAPDAAEDEAESPRPVSPYRVVRGTIHAHSPYSHDGCDGNGLPGGVVNAQCARELRAAPCIDGLDFVYLTDHPSYMRDHTMTEDLLHDAAAGDRLVLQDGQPVANMVRCGDGREVLFTVGFETSAHSMPLGIRRLMATPDLYEGVDDATPPDRAAALHAAYEEAGAVHAVVHSEGPEITPPTIAGTGFAAMEWINLHAMFLGVLGGDTISGSPTGVFNTVKLLEPFLAGGGPGGPHADLAFLVIAPAMPVYGLAKWRAVQQSRPITGILGTDVHRNVSVDPVCAGSWQVVCEALAALFPNTLTLLISGGTIVLRDGDRVDSYARMMRWVENRLLVTDLTIDAVADALRGGRGYGLFSAYGDPEGFVFEGARGGAYVSMGDVVDGPVTIFLASPRPAPLAGAPFTPTDAAAAMVRTVLKRIDPAGGESTVVELTDPRETWQEEMTAPGAYYVEVWVRPFHLVPALGTMSELATPEYLWLLANPIRIR